MAGEVVTLRKKLKVISVGEPKPIGNATLYPFKATIVGKPEEKDYEFWSKTLVEYIKTNADIDVDIEYTQKGDYKHRKVIQLYKGGKPIIKPRTAYGGGGAKRGEDRTDARTAIMSITELWKSDKLKDDDPLVTIFKNWCKIALRVTVTDKK